MPDETIDNTIEAYPHRELKKQPMNLRDTDSAGAATISGWAKALCPPASFRHTGLAPWQWAGRFLCTKPYLSPSLDIELFYQKQSCANAKGVPTGTPFFYTVKRIVLVLEQWQLKDRTIGLVATVAGSAV